MMFLVLCILAVGLLVLLASIVEARETTNRRIFYIFGTQGAVVTVLSALALLHLVVTA